MDLFFKVYDNKYKNIRDVLKGHFLISSNLITKLKQSNNIFYNGMNTYLDHPLNYSDEILVKIDFEEESDNIVPSNIKIDILYEDDGIIAINKPANMPVHPSILHYDNTLSNALKFYFDKNNIHCKIRPVNRLDKDTTGIVIFAKNQYVQENLIKQMKNNSYKKYYLAILEGFLECPEGTIEAPIARKGGSIIEREVSESGAKSITHYKVLKEFTYENKNLSLVEFSLDTGRTHQIRVHSKYIGHPILGDTLYGNKTDLISRQALHAYKITFINQCLFHGTSQTIETDLPEDMKKIIK